MMNKYNLNNHYKMFFFQLSTESSGATEEIPLLGTEKTEKEEKH